MIAFDVDFNAYPNKPPIKFKHDPAAQEELKKKRTVNELLYFIKENNLQELVYNAIFNNILGFQLFPLPGHLEKREDGYYIAMADMEPFKADVPNQKAFDDLVSSVPIEFINVMIYTVNSDFKIYAMFFESKEKQKEFWESDLYYVPGTTLFLESTGIDTLRDLGKAINKGVEIYVATKNFYADSIAPEICSKYRFVPSKGRYKN